jgi:hypothetical protein
VKALKIILAAIQVASIVVIGIWQNNSTLSMPIVYGLAAVSAVLGGILAAKLNRAPGLWAMGTLLIPIVIPGVLCLVKTVPDRRYLPGKNPRPAGAEVARNAQGYCQYCVDETTDESPGSVSTMNGIGTALMGTRWSSKGLDRCPICGSEVKQKWSTFGFGVKPSGTYRILYLGGVFTKKYFGRRLKQDPVTNPRP